MSIHYPPKNFKEFCRLMKKLGFIQSFRHGKGKHVGKFIHPERKTSNYRLQPNFIIIPHRIYKENSKQILKQIEVFGFTEEEIRKACEK